MLVLEGWGLHTTPCRKHGASPQNFSHSFLSGSNWAGRCRKEKTGGSEVVSLYPALLSYVHMSPSLWISLFWGKLPFLCCQALWLSLSGERTAGEVKRRTIYPKEKYFVKYPVQKLLIFKVTHKQYCDILCSCACTCFIIDVLKISLSFALVQLINKNIKFTKIPVKSCL